MALASGTRLVIDNAALAELLRGPKGPVVRRMMADGDLVKAEAKRLCPVSSPDPVPGRRVFHRPGQLRDSIVKRVTQSGRDIVVQVGSPLEYARYVHEGTEPHEIVPRRAKWLIFYWARVGRILYAKHVNHPGTKANPFLTKALEVLRGRY